MSLVDFNPFKKFFENDEEEPGTDLTECREVLEFARTLYYPKLIAYLEREADAQLVIRDNVSMIQSAARINAFKEVKAHLKRQVRDAAAMVAREERGD